MLIRRFVGFFRRGLFRSFLRSQFSDVGIDPLDVGHRCRVAKTLTQLDNASVSPLALGSTRRNIGEEFFYSILLAEVSCSKTAGMKIASFAEGHHFLGKRPNGLGLGESGLNTAVLNEAADLVREHGIAVGGRAAKFDGFFLVAHGLLFGGFLGDIDQTGLEFLTKS